MYVVFLPILKHIDHSGKQLHSAVTQTSVDKAKAKVSHRSPAAEVVWACGNMPAICDVQSHNEPTSLPQGVSEGS